MMKRTPPRPTPPRRGAMSRYDDSDDVGGRPSPWEHPSDQVSGGRRWSRSGRQEARGQDQPSRDAGRRGGRRRGKEIVLGAAAILTTVIVVSTSLAAYARYRTVYGSIKRVAVSSAELGKHRPPYTAALNILVMGSDSRAGTRAFGNASVITGARSDTVMLLHIAPGHQRADIISFPRTRWSRSMPARRTARRASSGSRRSGRQPRAAQLHLRLWRSDMPVEDPGAADQHPHPAFR